MLRCTGLCKNFKQNLIIGAPELKPEHTLAMEELPGFIRTTSVVSSLVLFPLHVCNSTAAQKKRFKWKGSVRWLSPCHWSVPLPQLNNVLMQASSDCSLLSEEASIYTDQQMGVKRAAHRRWTEGRRDHPTAVDFLQVSCLPVTQ